VKSRGRHEEGVEDEKEERESAAGQEVIETEERDEEKESRTRRCSGAREKRSLPLLRVCMQINKLSENTSVPRVDLVLAKTGRRERSKEVEEEKIVASRTAGCAPC
jgi:hypothetical protein